MFAMLDRFPDFRRRLRAQLWRFSLRAQDFRIELLDRLIALSQDPIVLEKMAADRLDISAQLKDRMTKALYETVGHALSTWAGMESSLVTIVGYLLETPRVRAGVVMYSIMNFQVWLSVIGELFPLDERFAHLKPQWNKTHEKLKALQDTRNRLAHHTTYHGQSEDVSVSGITLRPINLEHFQIEH